MIATFETPTAEVRQIDELQSLKALIGRYARALSELKAESKTIAEEVRSVIENDATYSTAKSAADEVQRGVKLALAAINAKPEMTSLKIKQKEKREELKEVKETLSYHLATYIQLTGTNSIDTPTGGEVDLVQVVSIKPKQLALF